MPALPLDEAGKYVAAAYLVFLALILIYVAIMAAKLQRINRELDDLADLAEETTGTAQSGIAGARDEIPMQAAGACRHAPRWDRWGWRRSRGAGERPCRSLGVRTRRRRSRRRGLRRSYSS